MMPREPSDILQEFILNQFREIATEGRKLGLFLIIVSQRPDRLDTLVASECKNIAVLKLTGRKAVQETQKVFGIDPRHFAFIQKTETFSRGHAIIMGDWAGTKPKFLYGAARRTKEGGRNIRPGSWTG